MNPWQRQHLGFIKLTRFTIPWKIREKQENQTGQHHWQPPQEKRLIEQKRGLTSRVLSKHRVISKSIR
jgi:hypothetical protein